ncbi:MAG: hypothetical protein QGI75_06650 [Phycisphaerales bacterium]|jgi:hypothetical protein|nr:hypothetical protein [Phycisphaerales bacterium]MDP6890530.1 hypothetical protein [Phycisphaerales bacterium]
MAYLSRLSLLIGIFCMSSCAYIDHARHWMGDFVPSVNVAKVGGNGGRMSMDITTAVCTSDPFVHTSLWMTDLSYKQVENGDIQNGQILHIEMLFPPRAGETPIDPAATNLSLRYIVISNDEVGVYEGGGFGYPIGGHEDGEMSLRVEPSGLVLAESTDGFVDLLSPATLSAVFTGTCDDMAGHRLADGIDQFVTNALGRTIYVQKRDPTVDESGIGGRELKGV